jgi:hypothetical protein
MPRTPCALIVIGLSLLAPLFLSDSAGAQTVWSGLTFNFSKAAGADPMLPQNQDRITNNVWITRGQFGMGLLNAASECNEILGCAYTHNLSPEDTAWANGGMLVNSGETIAATNWQNLVFTNWEGAYGSGNVGRNILTANYRDAVVHLITDNIYLDLRFTDWGQQGSTSFAYQRATATAPPLPSGDYNHNGVIDGADYVVWRNTLGQSASPAGSGADGNQSGTIDAGDYTYWRQRFGDTVPGSAAGSGLPSVGSVPEPSAGFLLIWWLLALVRRCT